ncbi:MAG: nitrite/sulfite reductase, partial [Bryobacterales bacterium]|nr:nitrite/sulfite reductase [Bryobacterales bacterium]
CRDEACALVRLHDFGLVAVVRDGKRGFELYVGGGLGTVPQQAKLYTDFLPEEELLPMAQAVARIFARFGEKKNRNTARLKFLISKLGLEEFKRLVDEERKQLPPDTRWTSWLESVPSYKEEPLKEASLLQIGVAREEGFDEWYRTNVYRQRQDGYATVTIALPLGDITSKQLRVVADLARKYVRDTVRSTVEQNLVLRWVSEGDLPALYRELRAIKLAEPVAGTILDIAACPGTDTCKLGISSSRGLAGELREQLAEKEFVKEEAIRGLHIKISGCFNSCGQHHVADLGFYGVSRNKNGYTVPHFQVVLGGEWEHNAGSYGLAIGAVPSKRIPETVDRITSRYLAERQPDERFQAYIKRIGKAAAKNMLEDLMTVPTHDVDPSFYTDWADAREYSIGDIGVGECAGEVVNPIDFQLAACERLAFEAQLALEAGDANKAGQLAYQAMLDGAVALLKQRLPVFSGDPDTIVNQFQMQLVDTQLFHDPFAGAKFAQYFFRAHEERAQAVTAERAHQLVEESQLFIEASHACYARMQAAPAVVQ